MNKPQFNNARGSASSLQFSPPFSFKDMAVSVFPLRANLTRLQSFYDNYLNQDSESIRFEPFLPYVFLQILDYGKMSIEAANMGWVSQCEVAFCVPLRMLVKKNGAWHFHDWAANCPFIYVDNELSMSTGREVYGWPKVLARIDPSISEWVKNPQGAQQVFEIQTSTTKHSHAGHTTNYSPFLSVHHNPAPNFLDVPPRLNGMLDPLTSLPNMGLNFTKMTLDVWQTFAGITMDGISNTKRGPMLFNPEVFSQLLKPENFKSWADPKSWESGSKDLLWSMYPRMYMNTVNLKQFRDATDPSSACYQAITNSKMEFNSINGMGPLGQQNLAFGQIDGGYRIDMHRIGNQPVVEALGLEVDPALSDSKNSAVSLQPVFPFWLKVDMNYSRGRTLRWRTQTSGWQAGDGLDETPETDQSAEEKHRDANTGPTPAPPVEAYDSLTNKTEFHTASNLFNTARGSATQGLTGPFSLPNTTIRVLPLIADEATLNGFVQNYLNVEGHARFEAWGSHVYLIAYNFTLRQSEKDTASLFANREVNFAVPIKKYDWYEDDEYDLSTAEGRAQRDQEKLVSTALVTPFAYVDDASVAITSSEVQGTPTLRSEVGSPPHTWMNSSGPEAGQHLLVTTALVLPAVGVGAGASHEILLNVNTDEVLPYTDVAGWRRLISKWGSVLVDDLRRKYRERGWRNEQVSEQEAFRHTRALALEILSGKVSINTMTLKQFRDAWEPDKACYQAIVQGQRTIETLHEIHEISEPLNVWITKYPTQPIAKILGLIPKHSFTENNVEVFEAIRPFWLRADIREDLGQTHYERVADTQWKTGECSEQILGWRNADKQALYATLSDDSMKISYQQRSGLSWQRKTIGLHDDKKQPTKELVDELLALESNGEVREIRFTARSLTRPVMAHPGTLNHLDRMHVADLGVFLKARQGDELSDVSIENLRQNIGSVSPSTIVESILSRQWGRPSTHREHNPYADYVVNVDSLGPVFDEDIFYLDERRNGFWPQSGDDRRDVKGRRKGLAWQLWDDVCLLIEEGDGAGGYHQKTPDDPPHYKDKAAACLPDWFYPTATKKPSQWDASEWLEIVTGLKALIDWSHYRVDWKTIIRELDRWQGIGMNMHRQLSITNNPDAAGQPPMGKRLAVQPNVPDVLAERLQKLAER